MERSKLQLYKYCDSGRLRKEGFRKNKNGKVRIFKRLDCKKKFSLNFGFEKIRDNMGKFNMMITLFNNDDVDIHNIENNIIFKNIQRHQEMKAELGKYGAELTRIKNTAIELDLLLKNYKKPN